MNYNYQDVTGIEAAFAVQGLDIFKAPDFSNYPANMLDHKEKEWRCQVCISAINGDWVPDFKDGSQRKYYLLCWPVKDNSKQSGFGLSYDGYDYAFAYTRVGARLVFESSEKALHFWKYFKEVFEEYYLG